MITTEEENIQNALAKQRVEFMNCVKELKEEIKVLLKRLGVRLSDYDNFDMIGVNNATYSVISKIDEKFGDFNNNCPQDTTTQKHKISGEESSPEDTHNKKRKECKENHCPQLKIDLNTIKNVDVGGSLKKVHNNIKETHNKKTKECKENYCKDSWFDCPECSGDKNG